MNEILAIRLSLSESLDSEFKNLWISENINKDRDICKKLKNEKYTLYRAWEQFNEQSLYKKYLPDTFVISGSMNRTDKIIFHGGCQPCISQSENDITRCFECMYFKADWSKKDLSITK